MNCLIVDDEEVSRMIVRDFVERTDSLNLLGECHNAVDAFDKLKKTEVDILFLDIEMPGMTGIELVQSLEKLPQVVLITGRKDFGAVAFEYNLTDYLIKPIKYPRFMQAVEKAKQNLEEQQDLEERSNEESIYVKSDNKIIRLQLEDIYFIEALSDYVLINTKDKKYIVHATMKGLAQKLPSSLFVRVHRSYIVNITKVETIEDMQIQMPHKEIPIGNSYKNDFLSKLNL